MTEQPPNPYAAGEIPPHAQDYAAAPADDEAPALTESVRKRPPWLIPSVVIGGVVAAGLVVILILAMSGGSKLGWGRDAVKEGHTLGLVCDQLTPVNGGSDTAKCTAIPGLGGTGAVVTTSGTKDEQDYFVALVKDSTPNVCMIVGKGFVLSGATDGLDAVTGGARGWANQYGAYFDGSCF